MLWRLRLDQMMKAQLRRSGIRRGLTFNRLLRHEVVDRMLYTFAWDRLSNGRREVLVDDPPGRMRDSLLECKTLVANATTDVNEEWDFGFQPMAEFLLEGINIEEHLLPLTIGHHPLQEIVKARWHSQGPIKGHLIGSVAFLERAVGAIRRILVFGLGQEFR